MFLQRPGSGRPGHGYMHSHSRIVRPRSGDFGRACRPVRRGPGRLGSRPDGGSYDQLVTRFGRGRMPGRTGICRRKAGICARRICTLLIPAHSLCKGLASSLARTRFSPRSALALSCSEGVDRLCTAWANRLHSFEARLPTGEKAMGAAWHRARSLYRTPRGRTRSPPFWRLVVVRHASMPVHFRVHPS